MRERGKVLKKALGRKAYRMREKEKRRELKLEVKKWEVLTNEERASLNSQKRDY